jgi:hypothetical protein
MPTWKIHKYTQINRRGVQVQNVGGAREGGPEDDFNPLLRDIGIEGAEDAHALEPVDNEGPQRAIEIQAFKNERQRNVDTMYEPFRNA